MDDPSEVVLSKGYCEDCKSDDNLVTYQDGHRFCFSPGCGKKSKIDLEDGSPAAVSFGKVDASPPSSAVPYTEEYMRGGIKKRGLKIDTLRRFGYFAHKEGGKTLQVAPYYDQRGQLSHQKYRNADKEFWFESLGASKTKDCQLYGQHVWGEKFDRKIIITEGEHDAHSVAQATKFKIPAVSIIQGINSAVASLKTNYRWLDRFEEIILWFDNDEPGQSVIEECANLFAPGKVKTVKVPGVKDANELAQEGREGDIYAAVYAATTWMPEGIVNAADCVGDMDEPGEETIAEYPWPIIQEKTHGIRDKEVVYHVAGTGVGKTSVIVEIQHSLLKQGVKFGVMRFEDSRRKAQLDLMSRAVERRLHLEKPDKEYLRTLHTEVFGSRKVELLDPETASWDLDAILGYIRYMGKALDCKVIFLDPFSFVVAAANFTDERKAIDHVAYQFARIVKQTGVCLMVCHHLNRSDGVAHEEGGKISVKNIRGSGAILNFSMGAFGYERNQQGDRPDLTRTRGLKCRFTGWTGVGDIIKWDDQRGVLEPTDEPFPDNNDNAAFGPAPTQAATPSQEY